MAVSDPSPGRVHALVGFGMNSPNARRLASFYERAFGALVERRDRLHEHRFIRWGGVQGGAECTVMRVGEASIELLEFDHPGRPYPQHVSPFDTRFQHLGIVVSDMPAAMERLARTAGWTAISIGGPDQLPKNAGGVTAFKFRDPDGHPLELLRFAADETPAYWLEAARTGVYLGIDHSALSVADVHRSVRFYESLGLTISGRSLNQGIQQERLDGVPAPVLDVISLAPPRPTPHVELLHYHTTMRPRHDVPASRDASATRLIFSARDAASDENDALIQDPDGHFLQLANYAVRHPTSTT
jgi:catechol 2,3-dioxygenase-like lactoylglutathione lyase family enzyme